jgi:hypothetical protein
MSINADRAKADDVARKLTEAREKLKDPLLAKSERRRLKLQRDTYQWVLERIDPERVREKRKLRVKSL